MKLIQIIALTGAMAAVATGQQTGANSSKASGQPAAAAPAPVQSSAPAGKPTPATKKAESKAVPAKGAAVTGKTNSAQKAESKAVPAKGPAATGKTNGAQAAPAKTAGGEPGTKAGSAPTVPVAAGPQSQKTKPAGAAAKSVTAKSTAKAPAPKPAPVASSKTGGKKPASASKPAKPNVAKVEPAPRAEPKPPTPAKLLGAAGRRDPFVSPIRSATGVSPTSTCTSGKRCLNIPELVLQGTVRDISGKMMAVVTTSNKTRTYTLRENDQVFNGSVEKITSDSIIFREYVRDPLGRESAREVVKKLGPTT